MIGLRFALFSALVPLMGGCVAAFASVRGLSRGARLASYTTAGVVTIACEMFALAAIGLQWSLPVLIASPPATSLVLTAHPAPRAPATGSLPALLIAAAAGLLIVAVTVMAGAATSFDLLLFWGVKGVHFALARTI